MILILNENTYANLFEREQDVQSLKLATNTFNRIKYILTMNIKGKTIKEVRDENKDNNCVFISPKLNHVKINFNNCSGSNSDKWDIPKYDGKIKIVLRTNVEGRIGGHYDSSKQSMTLNFAESDFEYFVQHIDDYFNKSKKTFIHEFQHFQDDLRSDGEILRKKQSRKHDIFSTEKYTGYISAPTSKPDKDFYSDEKQYEKASQRYNKQLKAYRLQNTELNVIFHQTMSHFYDEIKKDIVETKIEWIKNKPEIRRQAIRYFDADKNSDDQHLLQVYKANLVGHPDNKVKGFINLIEDYIKFPLPKKLKRKLIGRAYTFFRNLYNKLDINVDLIG